MSEVETAPASQTEEAPDKAVVFEYGESATPENQEAAAPEQTSDEAPETVTPEKDETASETVEQPTESEAERLQKAEARAGFNERQNKRLQRQIDDLKSGPSKPEQQKDTTEKPKRPGLYDPGIDGDEDKHSSAMDVYEDAKIDRAISADRQARDSDRQKKSERGKLNGFHDKSDALAAEDPEYAKLAEAGADVQFSLILETSLIESDKGAELHKHILQNPDELLKINSLSIQYPSAAKAEISRILDTFGKKSTGQSQQKQTSTNAPDPIPIASGSSAPVGSGIPEGMVFED